MAEETGQIIAIGEWVLRTACTQMAQWRKDGLPDLTMAVNLSIRQLRQPIAGGIRQDGIEGKRPGCALSGT